MKPSVESPERYSVVLQPFTFPNINTISDEKLQFFWDHNNHILQEQAIAYNRWKLNKAVEKAFQQLLQEAQHHKIPSSILQEDLWDITLYRGNTRSLLAKKLRIRVKKAGYTLIIRTKAGKKALIIVPDKPSSTDKATSRL